MREYTFLGTKSFRSEHIKAKNIREAWKKTKLWYLNLDKTEKEFFGDLTTTYQYAKENDFYMSNWLHSKTLGNKYIKR